jgi:acetyl-CoA C-acetyltransferase
VLSSSLVADPLRLLNCSPVSDGAAAALLCPLSEAHRYTDNPIRIAGCGHATAPIALADRDDPAVLGAVALAGQRAYAMAGTAGKDVDVAEVHDCFSISEICCVEALSLVCAGEGARAARDGITALGGRIPVNTSGGLKSKGHPVGATGVAQAIEIFEQLREEAGDRQVENARIGLAQNMGGSGASAVVHIFERA